MTEEKDPPKKVVRRRSASPSSSRDSFSASLGGAGGGTALVAVAHQIGVTTLWGTVLLYAAPAVSVLFGAGLYQLRLRLAWYNERTMIKKARKTLEELLHKSDTSEGHKEEVRGMLEELDRSVASAEVQRIRDMNYFRG